MFGNQELLNYIEERLRETWSPEQIANTPCEYKVPSFKTIYRWLYEGYLAKGDVRLLRKKRKDEKENREQR